MTGKSSWIFFLWASLISTSSSHNLLQFSPDSWATLAAEPAPLFVYQVSTQSNTRGQTQLDWLKISPYQANVLQHTYLIRMSVWVHQGKITLLHVLSHKRVDRGIAWEPSPLSVSLITPALALTRPARAVQNNEQFPLVWQHCNSAEYSSLFSDICGYFLWLLKSSNLQQMHMQTQAKASKGTCKPGWSSLQTANMRSRIPTATSLTSTQAAAP